MRKSQLGFEKNSNEQLLQGAAATKSGATARDQPVNDVPARVPPESAKIFKVTAEEL